jgi:hypothetical protein
MIDSLIGVYPVDFLPTLSTDFDKQKAEGDALRFF